MEEGGGSSTMEAVKSPIFGHETITSVPTCSCSSSFVDIDLSIDRGVERYNSNILYFVYLERKNFKKFLLKNLKTIALHSPDFHLI